MHFLNEDYWISIKISQQFDPKITIRQQCYEFGSHYLRFPGTNSISMQQFIKLDELMARRQLKSPRSISGRSIHLTLVSKWSWSWMIYCHPLCAMSIGPPILRYSNFQNLTMKIHGQGLVCGQRSRSRLTLKIQRSRLWSMSNLMVTFEALEFNQYVCFSFRGNQTIFGWDIANSIFDLENSRSRSWQRSNPMVTFEP